MVVNPRVEVGMPPKLSVPLRFVARETPVRRGEPVTVGLPWPRGAVRDAAHFHLIAPDGASQTLQTKVVDRWPDGSVRWCLFDFLATVDGTNDGYRIEVSKAAREPGASAFREERFRDALALETGPARFVLNHDGNWLRAEVREGGERHEISASLAYPIRGVAGFARPSPRVGIESDAGPVRTRIQFHQDLRQAGADADPDGADDTLVAELTGFLDFFAASTTVRVQLTVRNPTAANHPGGNWDLGNGGLIDLVELAVHFSLAWPGGNPTVLCSPERGTAFQRYARTVEVAQNNSGGTNWRSSTHLTRDRTVGDRPRGYSLTADGRTISAERAAPIVSVERGGRFLGVTMPHFWENFPKAIEANEHNILLRLFPATDGPHELQGGEQKTHVFYVAFGKDTVTDEPLVWCRSPLLCHADPEWYASTGAIPYLTPKAGDPNAQYLKLVDQAIEGPDTFLHKREKIDEYGWRHFGDIYGDHEAVFWPGPEPMVSHYNNQYDCVAGFLYQFMRSGDPRWYSQGVECADHTCDIDVYHTDGDKAAYNRGLFWHTYHYAPADTGTHRSYPKSLTKGPVESLTQKMDQLGETAKQLKKSYAVGGGPASSHNYNTGLMLAYFLTGNPIYRDTAVDLARFVINMDDPATTVFRWLSRESTGYATESGGGGYHGPGRASANSVNALLVGHQLTGERAYLDKAEEIIRRVSHPKQNLERLDLLNAELRWFYTMFLQALGRYLDYKIELGELDRMYAYGRLTLLHYAKWMAANERPILDTPEKLQYPTETWAAQDMRKVEVFQYAAKHSLGVVKEKYLERAEWFFRYVERVLPTFPTKSLCRPVVLMMNFGWSRAWWQQHPTATAPEPTQPVTADEFGEWAMFVPQKAIAMKRAKRLVLAGAVGFVLVLAVGVSWLLTQ